MRRYVPLFVVLVIGALLSVLMAKVAFGLAAVTGISALVFAFALAGFFLARSGVRRVRERREA
jgi:hypothetical protein